MILSSEKAKSWALVNMASASSSSTMAVEGRLVVDTFSGPVAVADDAILARVKPVLGEKADTDTHGHDWMLTKIARAPTRI